MSKETLQDTLRWIETQLEKIPDHEEVIRLEKEKQEVIEKIKSLDL